MGTTVVWRDRVYVIALTGIVLVSIAAFGFSAANGDSGSPPVSSTPATAATATELARPTAAPTPVASATAGASLDARRKDDLQRLARALDTYRSRFGAYPSSEGGTQWACKTGLEAACALVRVKPALPFNDGTFDYLYRSDGATYTLVARLDASVTPNGCGAVTLPPELAGHPAYCIGS